MIEMFAFAIDTGAMAGTGTDEYLTYPGAPIGSGQMPATPFTIVGVDLTNDTDDDSAYAVIGHTGPNGDYVSQKCIGPARLPALMYPPGYGFAFDPATDQLHLHWTAQIGCQAHLYATVFYAVP